MLPTPLLIALQFLTRLPVRLPGMPAPEQVGRSLLWYPLVGLLLGALLLAAQALLNQQPAVLQAALLLTLWVALSGGLHLDGLADTADAWVGGYGDRERTLAIMKDPRSGPIAVVVLVLLLLLKFAALLVLLQAGQTLALLLAPWLGRSALPLLLAQHRLCAAGRSWERNWPSICHGASCPGCSACIWHCWPCSVLTGCGRCWRPRWCLSSGGGLCWHVCRAPPAIRPERWSS